MIRGFRRTNHDCLGILIFLSSSKQLLYKGGPVVLTFALLTCEKSIRFDNVLYVYLVIFINQIKILCLNKVVVFLQEFEKDSYAENI